MISSLVAAEKDASQRTEAASEGNAAWSHIERIKHFISSASSGQLPLSSFLSSLAPLLPAHAASSLPHATSILKEEVNMSNNRNNGHAVHKENTEGERSNKAERLRKLHAYVVQAALLLSVEDSRANEEATRLFLESGEMQRMVEQYWNHQAMLRVASPSSSGAREMGVEGTPHTAGDAARTELDETGGRRHAVHGTLNTTSEAPLFPLEALPSLLDPAAVTAFVRRRYRAPARAGQWVTALRWLHSTSLTPAVAGLRIDICRRVGHWRLALAALQGIPPPQWTEMDVSGTLQSLYEEARKHATTNASSGISSRPARSALSPQSSRTCEEQERLGTKGVEERAGGSECISPEGDTAPLVKAALGIMRTASHHVSHWSSPAALNSTLALLLSASPSGWREALELLEHTLSLSSPAPAAALQSERNEEERMRELDGDEGGSTRVRPGFSSSPNYFDRDAEDASSRLVEDNGSNSSSDVVCLEKRGKRYGILRGMRPNAVTVFHTCQVFQSQWAIALACGLEMIRRYDVPIAEDLPCLESLLEHCVEGQRWTEALEIMERSNMYHQQKRREGGAATLHGTRDHHSASSAQQQRRLRKRLQIPLATLLCQNEGAYMRHPDVFSPAAMSKYFNHHTLSRAYNTLLQHSTQASDATHWRNELQRLRCSVENESLVHLVTLHSKEGAWRAALSSLEEILQDPARQRFFVPTAALHDTVQYALEQAPPPGASWEVSVRLFTDFTSTRQVPLSDVAFQSVVKKCFSQGAHTQAQHLFEYLIRHGVKR